jgi:hypothetical protein
LRRRILLMAMVTQSVGVPSMVWMCSSNCTTRRGRFIVREWLTAELSRSGATITASPSELTASWSARMPGA